MAAFYENGKYQALIVGQSLGENTMGNPEVQLRIKPIGIYDRTGEVSNFDGPYERTIYLVLTDATLGTPDKPGWVMQLLQFLGFNGTSFSQLDPAHPQAIDFTNKEVDAVCQVETYEGKDREKWNILRGGSNNSPAKPLPNKAIRGLDAKFGKLLKSFRGIPAPNSQANPTSTATTAAESPNDAFARDAQEIPF